MKIVSSFFNYKSAVFARWLWETPFTKTKLTDCAFFFQKLSQTIAKNNLLDQKKYFSTLRLCIYRTCFSFCYRIS